MEATNREDKIDNFSGDYSFLSNFYMTEVIYEGLRYTNSEAAYQAQKSADIAVKLKFVKLKPGKAKRKGSKVTLRKDWEDDKDRIMLEIVRAKFDQHPYLRDQLIATDPKYLEEGNNWNDTYWGVCKGVGDNKLGYILMQVRQEMKDLYPPKRKTKRQIESRGRE